MNTLKAFVRCWGSIFLVVLFCWGLVFVASKCFAASETPVDYTHVGSEPEYKHGAHCIDGRSF